MYTKILIYAHLINSKYLTSDINFCREKELLESFNYIDEYSLKLNINLNSKLLLLALKYLNLNKNSVNSYTELIPTYHDLILTIMIKRAVEVSSIFSARSINKNSLVDLALRFALKNGSLYLVSKYINSITKKKNIYSRYFYDEVTKYASISKNLPLIKYLLEYGNNFELIYHIDMTPEWLICSFKYIPTERLEEVMCYICKLDKNYSSNSNEIEKTHTKLSSQQVKNEKLEMVKYLTENKADLSKTPFCQSPLTNAAMRNDDVVVKYLLEQKSSMFPNVYPRFNVIHHFIENGNQPMVKYLYEKGKETYLAFDSLCNTDYHKDLFHYSATNDRTEKCDLLGYFYLIGFDENSKDCYLNTPVISATKCSSLKNVKYLASIGADIKLRNNEGYNALHIACGECNRSIIEFLIDWFEKDEIQNKTQNKIEDGKTKAGKNEEKKGYINCKTVYGDTYLHLLCKHLYIGEKSYHNFCLFLIGLFLDKNIDVNAQNSDGNTAMHIALERNFPFSILDLLKEYGTDLSIKNKIGSNCESPYLIKKHYEKTRFD